MSVWSGGKGKRPTHMLGRQDMNERPGMGQVLGEQIW